jgi:hypothetical protein
LNEWLGSLSGVGIWSFASHAAVQSSYTRLSRSGLEASTLASKSRRRCQSSGPVTIHAAPSSIQCDCKLIPRIKSASTMDLYSLHDCIVAKAFRRGTAADCNTTEACCHILGPVSVRRGRGASLSQRETGAVEHCQFGHVSSRSRGRAA